jgi:hypothetical protein
MTEAMAAPASYARGGNVVKKWRRLAEGALPRLSRGLWGGSWKFR